MRLVASVAACVVLLAGAMLAQQPRGTTGEMSARSVMFVPSEAKWSPAPAGLPAGAEVAVLEGDPSQPGPFTLQLKVPDGYRVEPHWHPTDERQTVVQGTFMMGMGNKWTDSEMKELNAGAFVMLPARNSHYVVAKGESILQVSANGPFDITYVDAKDDPRKK